MHARRISASLLATAMLLGGCAPQVELKPLPVVLSTDWGPDEIAGGQIGSGDLWDLLGSAELRRLVDKALSDNPDIAIASARIEQARAQLDAAHSILLPQVSVSAGATGSRSSGAGSPVVSALSPRINLSASYTLDLFGAGRANTQAARARWVATGLDRRSVSLDVTVQVARAYLQYASLNDRIAVAEGNQSNAVELQRIIDIQVREGVVSKLEQAQQRTEVANLVAEMETLKLARKLTTHAIAALVGEEAPLFQLGHASLEDFKLPSLAPGQPSTLLARRPDLGAAEARIAAAQGDVAAARAAFFPSLSISAGGIGTAAAILDPLRTTVSIGTSLLAPIFSGGRLKRDLRIATAFQAETVELYRKALLGALQETEDALASVGAAERREAALRVAQEEARVAASLATKRYSAGYAPFQTVLDSRRSLLSAEDAHAQAVQERLDAVIAVYRALGGPPAEEAGQG